MNLGLNIKKHRLSKEMTQEELAEKLNISRQSVSKWERAESCPDTDNLIELAKIYNVTLDESLKLYAEGVKLLKFCNSKLEQAQIKISEIDSNMLEA